MCVVYCSVDVKTKAHQPKSNPAIIATQPLMSLLIAAIQIESNGTILGGFKIRFQYTCILVHRAKMYWKLNSKSPRFVPFWVNSTLTFMVFENISNGEIQLDWIITRGSTCLTCLSQNSWNPLVCNNGNSWLIHCLT